MLYHFNDLFAEARMYQNLHGRFTAVDPLISSGKSVNPQTFNRYVYVANNPLLYTDPTGLQMGDVNGPVYYTEIEPGRYAFSSRRGYSSKSGLTYNDRWTGGKQRIKGIDGYEYTVWAGGWRQHGLDRDAARPTRRQQPTSQTKDPINTALLEDLGARGPATLNFLGLTLAAGAIGGLSAVPAVGAGGFIFASTVFTEGLLAEQFVRQTAETQHENAMIASIEADRQYGVDQAWKQEAELVRQTGEGTRPWTAEEKRQLLETGRVKGYEGHHINSVNGHPEQARDPSNVEFKTRPEHFEAHERNWRNISEGRPVVRRPR